MTWQDLLTQGWVAGINEKDLLRMTFAEVHRAFKGHSDRMDSFAILAREVAYYCYAQVGKRPLQPKDVFWPIGEVKDPGVTQEYTDMIYKKYGKLHEN